MILPEVFIWLKHRHFLDFYLDTVAEEEDKRVRNKTNDILGGTVSDSMVVYDNWLDGSE